MCMQCVYGYLLDKDVSEGWDSVQEMNADIASIDWPTLHPEQERLTKLTAHLYSLPECSVGGPLHIVTDDCNLEDESLEFCQKDLRTHWSVQDNQDKEVQQDIIETAQGILSIYRSMNLKERAAAWSRAEGEIEADVF